MKLLSVVLLIFSTGMAVNAQKQAVTTGSGPVVYFTPGVSGSGTKNYVPLWQTPSSLGDSAIFQINGNVGIDTVNPMAKLDVNGDVNASRFLIGNQLFSFGVYAKQNAFTGFAGNAGVAGLANTAVGYQALASNIGDSQGDGSHNTAVGMRALFSNNDTSGTGFVAQDNTAIGYTALYSNTTANQNVATGFEALYNTTTGSANTANGAAAAFNNTTGSINVAIGAYSLGANTTGNENTAIGASTLVYNTTGFFNTALGYGAGPDANSPNLSNATAIGATATVSQSNTIVLGGIGDFAVRVGIGTTAPSNVFTIAQGSGDAIADGWKTYSSRRWKTDIQTLQGALEKVEHLRGVSYTSKASGDHEIGVIAEEVGAVVPEVVSWEKSGNEAQSVDYGRLSALLIEATKEQQRQIEQQQEQIRLQQAQVNAQQAQIDQLSSQLKAIRASLEIKRNAGSEIRTVSVEGSTIRQ